MKQLIQNFKNGKLKIEEVPMPAIKAGGVLVRNCFSLISAGTDRMMIELAQKSIVGKAKERPDLVKQVINKVRSEGLINTFRKVMGQLDSPSPLGYSCAGVVMDVGGSVDEFKTGDRVACAGAGYANHAEVVFVPKNLCVNIPENIDFESGFSRTFDFAGELLLPKKLSGSRHVKPDKSGISGSPRFLSIQPVHYPDDVDCTSSQHVL